MSFIIINPDDKQNNTLLKYNTKYKTLLLEHTLFDIQVINIIYQYTFDIINSVCERLRHGTYNITVYNTICHIQIYNEQIQDLMWPSFPPDILRYNIVSGEHVNILQNVIKNINMICHTQYDNYMYVYDSTTPNNILQLHDSLYTTYIHAYKSHIIEHLLISQNNIEPIWCAVTFINYYMKQYYGKTQYIKYNARFKSIVTYDMLHDHYIVENYNLYDEHYVDHQFVYIKINNHKLLKNMIVCYKVFFDYLTKIEKH